MTLELPLNFNVLPFLTALLRLGGFLIGSPMFSSSEIPLKTKAMFTLALAVILTPITPTPTMATGTMLDFATLCTSELLLGVTVALAVRLIMEIFLIGGALIDRDLGYGMTFIFDPATESESSVLSALFVQLFLFCFITFDGHLLLVSVAAESFRHIEPGSFAISEALVTDMVSFSQRMFVVGFKIGLPIFTIVLFINIAMALMSKFGQEFEVMMLSFPIRLGLGLFVLSTMMPILVFFLHQESTGLAGQLAHLMRF